MEHIEYVLVLASFFELCLISVAFSKKNDYNSIMVLHKTEISIPTEHVIYNQIIGSSNGRLFVGGDNGKVYDILYQVQTAYYHPFTRTFTPKTSHTLSSHRLKTVGSLIKSRKLITTVPI